MIIIRSLIATAFAVSIAITAMGQVDSLEPCLPANFYDYVAYTSTELPNHFTNVNGPQGGVPAQDNTPVLNPVTNEGATLGRVLFYDKNMSINNTISCSSCHQQQFAFSDTATLSLGFDGGHTGRHSMGLSNAKYYSRGHFFWDERANTLEDQVLMNERLVITR